MSDDNIIDFETAKSDLAGITTLKFRLSKPRKDAPCFHHRVIVYDRDRKLECENCGADVDPFKFIADFARKQRWLQHCKEELASLRTEVDELKREEKNIKARIRRAKKKVRP